MINLLNNCNQHDLKSNDYRKRKLYYAQITPTV